MSLERRIVEEQEAMNKFKKINSAFTISLLASDGKFSYSQGSKAFSKVSQYQMKRFLDKDWDANQALEDYVATLDIDWSSGWLMIDDTVIEKPYAKKIECLYWTYSSKQDKIIQGITLTILAWSNGNQTIPLRFMLYEKDLTGKPIQTKNEFATEAVKYALDKGIRPEYICFDSKYASNNLLNLIQSFGCTYFTQLACNRNFKGLQLKARRFQPYVERGSLKGVGHNVGITKYYRRYYATNATGERVTSQFIVKHYRPRWKIEVLFRTLKQLCHLRECQSLTTKAQQHYVYMCIQAFMLLQDQNQKSLYQAKIYFQQKFLNLKINANNALRLLSA